MKNIDYNDLVRLFTGGNENRQWSYDPFSINEHVYATDGYIIIRVPKDKTEGFNEMVTGDVGYYSLVLFEKIWDLDFKINTIELGSEIDKVPKVDEYENSSEDGKCYECDEDNEVEWEYGDHTNFFDCPVCDGDGIISVDKREKTSRKIYSEISTIKILQSIFSLRLLNKLFIAAESIDEPIITVKSQKSEQSPTIFVFGDIEILIMPMIKSKENKVVKSFSLV